MTWAPIQAAALGLAAATVMTGAQGWDGAGVLQVSIHDSAAVPAGVLAEARQEADRIFRDAGVELSWLDCSPSATDGEQPSACLGRLAPSHLIGRIVARRGRDYQRLPSGAAITREILGQALCVRNTDGSYFTIYYSSVERMAAGSHLRCVRRLGYAIAHEIGHLLLGPQHSTGIMAADSAQKDVLKLPADQLLFSASDRERLVKQARSRARAN